MLREVFDIEMKLRKAISLIYLAAPRRSSFYHLLEKDKIDAQKSQPKDEKGYLELCENEFYHLTFSQYTALNARREVTQQKDLIEIVTQAKNFEEVQARLLDNPINDDRDADLPASLRKLPARIEDFRNSVAHNRRARARTIRVLFGFAPDF